MKKTNPPKVIRLAEAWAYVYTIGLPGEARKARRDEIKSDIWEHRQDLERQNKSSIEIVSRLLRGIPADIIWRFSHSQGSIAKAFMSLPQAYIKVLAVMAGIFILLPLVTVSLVITLLVVIILGFIIAFPFYYKAGTIILGSWVVDTLGEAVILSVLGLVFLALVILLLRMGFKLVRRHVSIRIGGLPLGWSK